MGSIIDIQCPKCGYKHSAAIGQGIRFNRLENVIEPFDKETKEKIRKAVGDSGSIWSAYREIGECKGCKKIVSGTVFILQDEKGNKTGFVTRCSCGGELKLLGAEAILRGKKKAQCPKCREILEIKATGNWD